MTAILGSLTIDQVIATCLGLTIGFLAGIVVVMVESWDDLDWQMRDAFLPLVCLPAAVATIFYVAITVYEAIT